MENAAAVKLAFLALMGLGVFASSVFSGPAVSPALPSPDYALPELPSSPDSPVIYSHSADAGPDETFFVVGARLTDKVEAWGPAPGAPAGQLYQLKTQFCTGEYLAATLPEKASDGPFAVWVRNDKGCSKPFVLNAPAPWWCGPDAAAPGESFRVFGRNLARRPDFSRAFLYLAQPGKPGRWLTVRSPGKYSLTASLPEKLDDGDYEIWVHAGVGGAYGWGGPAKLTVKSVKRPLFPHVAKVSGDAIQPALDQAAKDGGTVMLPAGTFAVRGTLRIPKGVTLKGAGKDQTTLQFANDMASRFARLSGSAWNQSPQRIHTIGDTLEYRMNVPAAGEWTVWLRYATEMSPWGQKGMDDRTGIAITDDGPFTALMNLPNTGSFGTYKWSKSTTIRLAPGESKLVWRNLKGGGLAIDAFVFALDPAFQPGDSPFPEPGPGVVIVQGEDVVAMKTKEGGLPSGDAAAVWLSGDGASVSDLTVLGTPQINLGVAVRAAASASLGTEPPRWISGCRIERVRVADIEGKHAEIYGVRLFNAVRAVVRDCELWGRSPLYLSGVRQCDFSRNRLVSVTRFGGNAEAAIQGRNDVIEECIMEDNVVACPPGAEAGGPTQRRLIWVSTGKGSITRNWMAGNRGDRARYGGVAGTDQNVGETILFEACQRIAYYGPLAAADAQSVSLPAVLPDTPDNRLGNVKRDQLAHDAGRETPFWPPDVYDASPEPPITEYYVTVLKGRGLGQTRRVASRTDTTLRLDRPWRETPEAGCLVVVSTMYYQNIVTGNDTPDGMTGIQLWISCVENIVSGNTISRQRKPGLFLYSTCTTLASSMPRTWNRGIGPLNWNHIEGNRTDECSDGALVTSGDAPDLPIEWPRAVGNVLRHNSFIKNRTNGVIITSRKKADNESPSVVGTVCEFNVVRDAMTAYHASNNVDATVFRRNHAYFWYPVSLVPGPLTAFLIQNEKAVAAIELNSVEGKTGTGDKTIVEVQRGSP